MSERNVGLLRDYPSGWIKERRKKDGNTQKENLVQSIMAKNFTVSQGLHCPELRSFDR